MLQEDFRLISEYLYKKIYRSEDSVNFEFFSSELLGLHFLKIFILLFLTAFKNTTYVGNAFINANIEIIYANY